jgi:hypothetical protein
VTLAFGTFSAGHTIPDADKLSIDIFHTGSNRSLDGCLDLLLDEPSRKWLEGFVQKVMLRVANGELEGVDLDHDALDLENTYPYRQGRDAQWPTALRLVLFRMRNTKWKLTVRPSPPRTTSARPESAILIPVFFLK